ncbi:hypothetical protein C8A03DRAFT_14300 [Achaetomium macrosporum]|uniref:Uncharacterized protein n=1 Tax=Achaetomium macrosporum TaxID=79813 RepID=A0AAN7CC38_9PEZI|nr:hypothetical protein C8A03DRAFT_14300 [Achaetomium macrosporum]
MSTLIGQAPTNLGPLTTTFTPPAACTVAVGAGRGGLAGLLGGGGDNDVAYLAQACSRGKAVDATSCWPAKSKGAEEKEPPLHGWGFYYPGLHCPVGYATACSATGGSGGSSGWPVQFKLRDGETAVGCCPSGYSCANVNGQTCTMVATSHAIPTVTCDGSKSGGFASQTIPDLEASITALSLFAPMIQINWQSSDRTEPSSTSTAKPTASSSKPAATKTASASDQVSASGTQTIDASPTFDPESETLVLDDSTHTTVGTANVGVNLGTDSPVPTITPSLQEGSAASDSDGNSFSSGAKVAIGVTGAVALAMVLVCALFYCWRRRQQRREEAQLDALFGGGGGGAKHTMTDGGDFTSNNDIPGWYRGQKLASASTQDPFVRDGGGGAWGMKEVEMQVSAPAPAAAPYNYRTYRS